MLLLQWLPTNPTFHQFHDLYTELDLHRLWVIMSGFHGAFATGVACQQGTLTLPDTWFRPHRGTCLCSNCWDQIPRTCHVFTRLFTSNTPWYFLDFACNISPRRFNFLLMLYLWRFRRFLTSFFFDKATLPSSVTFTFLKRGITFLNFFV